MIESDRRAGRATGDPAEVVGAMNGSGVARVAEGIKPDIVVEPIRPADGPETAEAQMLREKDLKGHIRGDREGEQKPAEVKDKDKGKEPDKGKEKTDLQKDNQLKSAVDILKSWEVFKRIGKN